MEKVWQSQKTITFSEAIALTQSLVAAVETGKIDPTELIEAITTLVTTNNGKRGFFVTYLTAESILADQPPPEIIKALQLSGDDVAELLVKNLAMSAAMALTHRRHGNEEMAIGSERVKQRTANLIKLVQLPSVYEIATQLSESAATGTGKYQEFFAGWGYDDEQKQLICNVLRQAIAEK